MDIFNRPTIAEDTLEYILYPGPGFHNKSSVSALAAVIDLHATSTLPNHIWHRDTFELKVVRESHDQNKWIIEGCMRVGDCVDDEWCVVWLLNDVSKRWDVTVSVFDSDGEFLLIEAAHHLPSWITPTNAENRVWLHDGRLHLVPLLYVSSSGTKHERRKRHEGLDSDLDNDESAEDEDAYISIPDAVRAVRDPDVETLAPREVETAAMRRTTGYPQLARQHLHRTTAYLPRDIVIALSNNHNLVQKATEAFYTRDAIQLRAATRMARFPPNSSILSPVTMTKAAYAQLVGQRFHPPKVFGAWDEREGTPEWRRKDIGMKIACGFEMLYQESKPRREAAIHRMDDTHTSMEASKEALHRDSDYTTYMQILQRVGYFTNEVEGSATWKERENRAAAHFIESRKVDHSNRPSFASLVDSAISQGEGKFSELLSGDEDSEEWLNVDENAVDDLLANAAGTKPPIHGVKLDVESNNHQQPAQDEMTTDHAGQLQVLAEKVENFVEAEGDVKGAMFEDDLFSDDDVDMADSDDHSESDFHGGEAALSGADRQAVMDNLVPAIEPSDYGRMPPEFHSNSQKVKDVTITDPEVSLIDDSPKQNTDPQPARVRPLIFPRDQYDGVEDSDDESEEGDIGGGDDEDEEDRPIVVGDVEIDMDQEAEEFLEFSREALGITPDMWDEIVKDRKGRGAFLPDSALRVPTDIPQATSQKPSNEGKHPDTNQKLDSFEAVMQAMDAELLSAKRNKQSAGAKNLPTKPPSIKYEFKDKGKQKAEEEDTVVDAEMDTELHQALQHGSDDDEDVEASTDYTLIKNFLESFKAQDGLSGPVGNLVGRLQPGWKLPRDEA